MTDPVTIVIPGTPRGKGRPRFSGATRTTYTDKLTKQYETTVGRMATLEMRGKEMFSGPLHLDMRAHFEIPLSWTAAKRQDALLGHIKPTVKPDLDNIQKAITDALNGIVYDDDSAIVSVNCSKVYAAGEPFVVATIKSVQSVNRVPETQESAVKAWVHTE